MRVFYFLLVACGIVAATVIFVTCRDGNRSGVATAPPAIDAPRPPDAAAPRGAPARAATSKSAAPRTVPRVGLPDTPQVRAYFDGVMPIEGWIIYDWRVRFYAAMSVCPDIKARPPFALEYMLRVRRSDDGSATPLMIVAHDDSREDRGTTDADFAAFKTCAENFMLQPGNGMQYPSGYTGEQDIHQVFWWSVEKDSVFTFLAKAEAGEAPVPSY